MKEGWQSKPFEDCIEKVVYTTKIQRNAFLPEGSFPVVSQEEGLINGYWNKSADLFRVERPLVLFGDHTRSLKYVDFDFALGADGVKILKPKPFLDPRFFFYSLHTVNLQSLGYARHYRLLKEHTIHFPPLADQKRIAAILDQAFEAIDVTKKNYETNLANKDELFHSYLTDLLRRRERGWRDEALAKICIVERGSSPRPIKKYFTTEEGGVNWIKIGDTQAGGKYVTSTAQKITQEGAKQSRLVRKGDLILTNSMSYGRPYIMKTEGYIHDGWFVLRPNVDIDTEYFYYLLSSKVVQTQFARLASGSVVKNISGDLVKQAVMPIPPIAAQRQIVEKLGRLEEDVERLGRLYAQKRSNLAAFKSSIFDQAFSGNL